MWIWIDRVVASGHKLASSRFTPSADRALVIVSHWAGAFSPDCDKNDFLLLRKTVHEEDLRSWLICKRSHAHFAPLLRRGQAAYPCLRV